MKFSKLFKKVLASGIAATALIGGLALTPTLIARADTPTPATAAAATAKPAQANPTRLQNLFKAEQKLQPAQGQRLDGTSKVISSTQQFIDKQAGLGRDTTDLVKALDAYKAAVASAGDLHQQAQVILDAHAGFDANGVVTDAAAARTTVTGAGRAQREFHLTMNMAAFDLRGRVGLWRIEHR